MGVGFYQPNTQFSKGEYPLADQKQDDFSIISAKLPYVTQVHGTTVATATALNGVANAGRASATANMIGIVRWALLLLLLFAVRLLLHFILQA
jgi:hypothetical protein